MHSTDVLILGAGAAGLMCAIAAGRRGRRVTVIDHARNPAEKIRISGGGRCNFTNINSQPTNFLSQNPRFAVSALKRYTPMDFLKLVESHGIAWHEKTLGQLFCDGSAREIIAMLLEEAEKAQVRVKTATAISEISRTDECFAVETSAGSMKASSLVVATGGPSIPKIGATGFGYDIARRFGLAVVPPRPALVPLTFDDALRQRTGHLAGVSVDAVVSHEKTRFREGLLFTHKGLSGPSVLQISSYWREGTPIRVDMAPGEDVLQRLKEARRTQPKQDLRTAIAEILPKRLAQFISEEHLLSGRMADLSDKVLAKAADAIAAWEVKPVGSEGYRTAEVTLGGVDTKELSSKTMESTRVPGLYFIGEVVDVTGHLGGHNFQWAWASGHAAGQFA